MNYSAKSATFALWTAILLPLGCAGCGMNRNYANNKIRQLPHSTVVIEYTVRATTRAQLDAEASGTETNPPLRNNDQKTLTITFPHPNPEYGLRCAELILRDAPRQIEDPTEKLAEYIVTNPFRPQESVHAPEHRSDPTLLRTVVNREQLEFLLRDLVADGFFDRENRQGDIDLVVTLGSRSVAKQWDRVKSLDELAARVVSEHAQTRRRSGAPRDLAAQLSAPTPLSDVEDDAPHALPQN